MAELKGNPLPHRIVFSFDEKAKIAIKEYKGYAYTKHKKIFYPEKQKKHGFPVFLSAGAQNFDLKYTPPPQYR